MTIRRAKLGPTPVEKTQRRYENKKKKIRQDTRILSLKDANETKLPRQHLTQGLMIDDMAKEEDITQK